MKLTHDILERLDKLEEKYAAMGQDIQSYLDGLLHADYLTYWDYIHLDTLLSLQHPRTSFPDEYIFITYHQITELFFKLIRQALQQAMSSPELLLRQLGRCNCYFEQLIQSFDIMIEGMDRGEFLQFRMSLLPASGFQSAQYRMIELMSTDMPRLLSYRYDRQEAEQLTASALYDKLYWRSGATELATGKKTLTLKQFETKYRSTLIALAEEMAGKNIRRLYQSLPLAQQQTPELREALRQYDFNVNVRWPLSHLRSAVRHLQQKPKVIEATGGTNWQQYLPPKEQRITFYPELWTEAELQAWGRKHQL